MQPLTSSATSDMSSSVLAGLKIMDKKKKKNAPTFDRGVMSTIKPFAALEKKVSIGQCAMHKLLTVDSNGS